MLVEEKVAAGMAPKAARRSALIEVGSVDHIKDATRSVRAGAILAEIGSDARFALRMMRRDWAFERRRRRDARTRKRCRIHEVADSQSFRIGQRHPPTGLFVQFDVRGGDTAANVEVRQKPMPDKTGCTMLACGERPPRLDGCGSPWRLRWRLDSPA